MDASLADEKIAPSQSGLSIGNGKMTQLTESQVNLNGQGSVYSNMEMVMK